MSVKKFENTQLYSLLRKLSSFVPNDDELETIVGYNIISSLIYFNTNTGSNEEVKFEEIKEIYKGLDKILDNLEKNPEFDALSELMADIDPKFKEWHENYSDNYKPDFGSELVNRAIKNLAGTKNLSEVLRRVGIRVNRQVYEYGPINRTVDALNNDYRIIENSFNLRRE